MRKLILQVALTLDGFIEGPNGEYDWCFTDQDYGLSDFFKQVDAVFMGRKSYELFFLQEQESAIPDMPKMQEYVFSRTLDKVKEGCILIKDDIRANVLNVKNQPGKDIWLFGGASLTSSLMNEGLVDELVIAVHPILLGSGKPLFSGIPRRIPLRLEKTREYSSGLLMLTYTIINAAD